MKRTVIALAVGVLISLPLLFLLQLNNVGAITLLILICASLTLLVVWGLSALKQGRGADGGKGGEQ